MSEELNELQEHAEHAKHDPTLAPISVTMAILAVLVAVVSLLGHRAHTEEVVLQAISSDTWANYQAKNIRRHTDELFNDLTSVEPTTEATTLAKLRDQYSQEADRYKDEMKELRIRRTNSMPRLKSSATERIATIWPKSSWKSGWSSRRLHCSPVAGSSGL
jgi:inorganic triphosphatase YgiF